MSWLRYFQNDRNYVYNEIHGDVYKIERVYKEELNIPLYDDRDYRYYYYNLLRNDTFYSLITTQGGSPPFRLYISKFDGKNYTIKLLNTYPWISSVDNYDPRMLFTNDNIYAFYRGSYYIISFDLESITRIDVNSGYQNLYFMDVHPIEKGDYIYMWAYAYTPGVYDTLQLYKIRDSNYYRVDVDLEVYYVFNGATFGISNDQLYFSIYYGPEGRNKLIRINEQDLSFELLKDIRNLYYIIDDDDNFYITDHDSGSLTKLDKDLNQLWQNSQINQYHTFMSRTKDGNLVFQAPCPDCGVKIVDKNNGSTILNLSKSRYDFNIYVLRNDICIIDFTTIDNNPDKQRYRRYDKNGSLKYEKTFDYSQNPIWYVMPKYIVGYHPPLNLFMNSKAMNVWYTYYYDNGYKLKFEAYQASITSRSSNFFFFLRRHEE